MAVTRLKMQSVPEPLLWLCGVDLLNWCQCKADKSREEMKLSTSIPFYPDYLLLFQLSTSFPIITFNPDYPILSPSILTIPFYPRVNCQLHGCHMEYSIWYIYMTPWSTPWAAIWSTPYGTYIWPRGVLHGLPYGVLHKAHIFDPVEYSMVTIWSTPHLRYGVLHLALI